MFCEIFEKVHADCDKNVRKNYKVTWVFLQKMSLHILVKTLYNNAHMSYSSQTRDG
jgi:hypothetical protein